MSDIPKVVENTTEISKVTHADPRCTASCIAVTTAVSGYLADILFFVACIALSEHELPVALNTSLIIDRLL